MGFSELGVYPALEKAIYENGIKEPSEIQKLAFPSLLKKGKSLLVKSPTGSGKTLIYVVSMLNQIFELKERDQKLFGIILVPTRELAGQIKEVIQKIISKIDWDKKVIVTDLCNSNKDYGNYLFLNSTIIITTPIALIKFKKCCLEIEKIFYLIVDEADLMFDLGYNDSLKEIVNFLPSFSQGVLVSATLNEKITNFRDMFLNNFDLVSIKEINPPNIKHYKLNLKNSKEIFLFLYAIFKLGYIKGKALIFSEEKNIYKLSIFFQLIGISNCAINNEIPIKTRIHLIEAYNLGNYKVAISASNLIENCLERGIDFKEVECVINFDMPNDKESYFHRAGRAGRDGSESFVISFPKNELKADMDLVRNLLSSIDIKDYQIDYNLLLPFNYRIEDIMSRITPKAILRMKLHKIKEAIIISDKLKEYFEKNPKEFTELRRSLKDNNFEMPIRSLKSVPEYLISNYKKVPTNNNRKRGNKKLNKTFKKTKLNKKKKKGSSHQ